jgi:cytochrome o ubiquinol oxidase subunit 2
MKRLLRFVLPGLLPAFIVALMGGCNHVLLLDPKGPIGADERFLILTSFALMLLVVVPVIIMTIWFPLKYRERNSSARYDPRWSASRKIEVIVWLAPTAIVLAIAVLAWKYSHKLDPYKPINVGVKPVNIEAVSLDWKWLFIYPDENIAVVNQLTFPAQVPLSFRITSASVMTSLFIPQLGSQIYGMAGMQTRLHLLASQEGVYDGQNQQFSGAGYSDMQFKAIATTRQKFEDWIRKARLSHDTLNRTRYRQLETPSIRDSVSFFSAVEPGLFDSIIRTFDPSMRKMNTCGHLEMLSAGMPMTPCASEEK